MAVENSDDRENGNNKKPQGDRLRKKDRQAPHGYEQGLPGGSFSDRREEKGDQEGGDGKPEFLHIVAEYAENDH